MKFSPPGDSGGQGLTQRTAAYRWRHCGIHFTRQLESRTSGGPYAAAGARRHDGAVGIGRPETTARSR